MIHRSGGNTGQKNATGNSDKASEDDPKSLFPLKSWWLLKDMTRYYIVTFTGQRFFFLCIWLCPHFLPQSGSQGNKNDYILECKGKAFSYRNTYLFVNDKKPTVSADNKTTTKTHCNVGKKTEISFFTYSHHNTVPKPAAPQWSWNDLLQCNPHLICFMVICNFW